MNLNKRALEICKEIYSDYAEAELTHVPKSMFHLWKIGQQALFKAEACESERTPLCCLGADHKCILNVNDGYCRAIACQYKVQEID